MEFDDASPANSYSNSQNSNNVVEDEEDEDEEEEEEEEEEETSIHEVVSKGSILYDSENSYDDPPSKRIRVISRKVDRLSNLPEPMITHILSFMPVIDAVKTQLISKRFRYLWASITTLLFGTSWVLDGFNPEFTSNVLMLHRGPLIKKFKIWGIQLSYFDGVEPPINLWVQAVVIKRIEELVLGIVDSTITYLLPNCLLMCDTLRKFRLTASKIELGSNVCWKLLKNLTLKLINNLSDDMIRNIVAGSPALESLRLIRCWGFSRVMINSSSSNLRHLEIDCECPGEEFYQSYSDDENDNIDEYLEISAPKVTSFEISGYMGNRFCRLKEVSSSLVRVALRFRMNTIVGSNWDQRDNLIYEASRAKLEKCEWALLDLLSKVSHVDKLTMGSWCTQVLSLCELRRKPEIFIKCKILKVDGFHARSLPGIARLLQKSPCLHTLIIDMNNVYLDQVQHFFEFSDFSSQNYWQSQERSFKNALQCLKIIQLKGLDDTTSVTAVDLVMELAAFLLQNAKFLEKLEYKTCDYAYHCLQHDFRLTFEFDVIKKLLSCPRSSPHARVLLL